MKTGIAYALLVTAAGVAGGLAALPRFNEPTRLTFLAVGQGDCAVFQTGGRTVLIDCGPKTPATDAGKKIVLPALRRMGVGSIDLILLSHPDMDHVGGLGSILAGMPVAEVAVSEEFRDFEPMTKRLAEAGVPTRKTLWLSPSQTARVGDFAIEVDCPDWHEGEPDNDGSEFVKIRGDGSTAVMTGDAGVQAESQMIPGHNWSAQVLKLGHHGSRTASSSAFLSAVHPNWAVVSVGRNNVYGLPNLEVLERARKLGATVLRTDLDGTITFDLGPNGWTRAQ